MSSRHYHLSLNSRQEILLPSCVDEYVSQTNTVWAINVYVNTVALQDKVKRKEGTS